MNPLDIPDRDPRKLHPLLWQRWLGLRLELEALVGGTILLNEGYRSDARQGWLYGQGRTEAQLLLKGVDPAYARSGPIVTNAWSAKTSAHGWTVGGAPASAAIDVDPLGPDGKPFTADDPWERFVDGTDDRLDPLVQKHGLIHFRAAGKQVWDKPHIQLINWNDATHQLGV